MKLRFYTLCGIFERIEGIDSGNVYTLHAEVKLLIFNKSYTNLHQNKSFTFNSRYRMVYHKSDTSNRMNPYRYTLLVGAAERQPSDGLSSLQYTLASVNEAPLYVNFTVDIGQPSFNQKMKSFGTGIDIFASISLLIFMIFITGFACFRSRFPHTVLSRCLGN